jgi:hypothetical protein
MLSKSSKSKGNLKQLKRWRKFNADVIAPYNMEDKTFNV